MLPPKTLTPLPKDCPPGVVAAAWTWLAGAIAALVLNVLLLGFVLLKDTPPPLPILGMLIVWTVIGYALLVGISLSVRAGRWRDVAIPAGAVFLAATLLLLVNGASAYTAALAFFPQGWGMRVALVDPVWATTWLVLGLGFVVVDLVLLLGSAVLLGQSARYGHWVLGGHRQTRRGSGVFPRAVLCAGWTWVAAGTVVFWMVMAWFFLCATPLADAAQSGHVMLVAGLMSIPALTLLSFGLLVLTGRLPALLPVGQFVQFGAACALLGSLAVLVGDDETRTGERVRAGLVVVCAGLAFVASWVCMLCDEAYRRWLRTACGLRVAVRYGFGHATSQMRKEDRPT